MNHRLPPFEIDSDLYELRRDGALVKVEPKVFNFLLYLAERRDRVVLKQEIYDELWPDEIVSESALAYCVKSARRVLRTGGRGGPVIKTIHGRGFRMIAEAVDDSDRAAGEASGDGSAPGLIGRGEEVAQIVERLRRALQREPQVLGISGVAGIGKSRLAAELARLAGEEGADVVVGHCYEGEDPPAFHPWIHIFREFAETHEAELTREILGTGAADIAQLTPSLRKTVTNIESLPAFDPGQARARFFDSVVAFLAGAAERTPLVLVFEDLHWADEATLLLIETAVRELASSSLVWVFTYRDIEVERTDRLGQMLVSLGRETAFSEISLGGLSSVDTTTLVRNSMPDGTLDHTVGAVAKLSEGNPLFALELSRFVGEDGGHLPERWGRRGAKVTMPGGIAGVIARRLGRLSSACRRTLADASVIGRTFAFDLLRDISSCPEEDLLDAIEAAVEASVIVESPDGESYSFAHGLIRQAVYQELSAARRARIHRRVAEVLERRTARDPHAPLAELAHHFFQSLAGGDAEKTIYYSTEAAADALRRYAHEDAARLYQQALEAMEIEGSPEGRDRELRRCDLLLHLGEAQSLAGDPGGSRETYDRAAELARELDTPDRLARAALRGSGSLLQGLIVDDASIEVLEESLDKLRPGNSAMRARVLSKLALTLYYHPGGSRRRRMELSTEAVEIARELGDPETLYWALISRYWALWGPASAGKRLAVIDELMSIGAALGSPAMAARAQAYRVGAFLDTGDISAVDEEIARAAAFSEQLRVPLLQWSAGYFASTRALLTGDFARAEELRVRSFAAGARIDPENSYLVSLLQEANSCFIEGRMDEFSPKIEALVEQGVEIPVLHCAIGLGHAAAGRKEQARESLYGFLARDLSTLPEDNLWLTTMAMLASIAAHLGEEEPARKLYAAMEPYADQLVTSGNATACFGSTHHYLGICASLFGNVERREQHYEEALATHRAIDSATWTAGTLWARSASIFRTTGKQSEHERASAMAREAAEIAERVGAVGMSKWIAKYLEINQARSPKRRRASSPKRDQTRRRAAKRQAEPDGS